MPVRRLVVTIALAVVIAVPACGGDGTAVVSAVSDGAAAGDGSVWALTTPLGGFGALSRRDPDTGEEITTVPLGHADARGIAAGEGSIWVVHEAVSAGVLTRVDPRANEVSGSFPVAAAPKAVDVGEGWVWVVHAPDGPGTLSRVDPESGEVMATAEVGHLPSGVAVGEGSVWVLNAYEIVRVDPASMEVTDRIDVLAEGIAMGLGSVWITSQGQLAEAVEGRGTEGVERRDPTTGELQSFLPLGDHPYHVSVGAGSLWVSHFESEMLTRLDPDSGEATDAIDLAGLFQPYQPTSATVGDETIWYDGLVWWVIS